jgi:chromosome segregation ATPase
LIDLHVKMPTPEETVTAGDDMDDKVAQLLHEMAALKHEKQEQENTLEESQEELNSLRQRSERMELEIHALKQAAKMLCEQLMVAKREAAPTQQPIEDVRKRDTELLREALDSLRAVSQERDHYEKEVSFYSWPQRKVMLMNASEVEFLFGLRLGLVHFWPPHLVLSLLGSI